MKTIIKISLSACIAIALTGNGRTFACGQRTFFMTQALVPYSKKIPLAQEGKNKNKYFTTVGYWWYDFLNQWKWIPNKHSRVIYAVCSNNANLKIHRLIMALIKGDKIEVDHINHNGLDNTDSNLRKCTRSQNMANKFSWSKTGHKGVSVILDYSKKPYYISQIKKNKIKYYLGLFPYTLKGLKDASMAYQKKALELHGEFTKI